MKIIMTTVVELSVSYQTERLEAIKAGTPPGWSRNVIHICSPHTALVDTSMVTRTKRRVEKRARKVRELCKWRVRFGRRRRFMERVYMTSSKP